MYNKQTLQKFHITKLAEWYNTFNRWNWPKDYVFPIPEGFDELSSYDNNERVSTKYTVSRWHMETIEKIIGWKECLRYHHIVNMGHKNYQFELWWFFKSVNHFAQKIGFSNFYINIYQVMNWRMPEDRKIGH